MDIYKLKELSLEERDTILEGEALKVEEQAYMRPLSKEELDIKKDDLASAAILKAVIEEELQQIKEDYKLKLTPLRDKITEALSALKNKAEQVKGKVYQLADYENQMIHYVDPMGHVLSSRRMLPEERQFRITTTAKAM